MNGLFKIYETVEANIKPLDSMAETLSKLIFFDISIILSISILESFWVFD